MFRRYHDSRPSIINHTYNYNTYDLNSLDSGHFSIHAVKGEFDDTKATITNTGYLRNISAYFSNEGKTLHGIAAGRECENLIWGDPRNYTAPRWFIGPAPPPPPPPPSMCPNQFNKTACDSLKPSGSEKGCSWCVSTDGVHQLCFDDDTVPKLAKADWKCDKSSGL